MPYLDVHTFQPVRHFPGSQCLVYIANLTNRTPPTRYNSPYLSSTLSDTRYDDYYGRTMRIAMDIKF